MKKTADYDLQAIKAFNEGLDRLVATGDLTSVDTQDKVHGQMLAVAHALMTADPASLSKGRAQLRQRLFAAERTAARPGMRPLAKVAAALAVLLLATATAFVLSPPLRAWAQQVLARIGSLFITDAPTYAEQMLPAMLTATPPTVATYDLESLSPEEASRRAGFAVLVPHSPPKNWTQQLITHRSGHVDVLGIYDHWYSVNISQFPSTDEASEEFPIGDANLVEVTVRGQTGYWVEGAALSIVGGGGSTFLGLRDVVWQLAAEDTLIWEEGGIVYVIEADDELSLRDLLDIAESLE